MLSVPATQREHCPGRVGLVVVVLPWIHPFCFVFFLDVYKEETPPFAAYVYDSTYHVQISVQTATGSAYCRNRRAKQGHPYKSL